MSGVRYLDLTFPPEGDTSLARLIHNCPLVEELTVKCDSKGEEECIHACRSRARALLSSCNQHIKHTV